MPQSPRTCETVHPQPGSYEPYQGQGFMHAMSAPNASIRADGSDAVASMMSGCNSCLHCGMIGHAFTQCQMLGPNANTAIMVCDPSMVSRTPILHVNWYSGAKLGEVHRAIARRFRLHCGTDYDLHVFNEPTGQYVCLPRDGATLCGSLGIVPGAVLLFSFPSPTIQSVVLPTAPTTTSEPEHNEPSPSARPSPMTTLPPSRQPSPDPEALHALPSFLIQEGATPEDMLHRSTQQLSQPAAAKMTPYDVFHTNCKRSRFDARIMDLASTIPIAVNRELYDEHVFHKASAAQRTIVIRYIESDISARSVAKFFTCFGPILRVRFCTPSEKRPGYSPDERYYLMFIEFLVKESADKAITCADGLVTTDGLTLEKHRSSKDVRIRKTRSIRVERSRRPIENSLLHDAVLRATESKVEVVTLSTMAHVQTVPNGHMLDDGRQFHQLVRDLGYSLRDKCGGSSPRFLLLACYKELAGLLLVQLSVDLEVLTQLDPDFVPPHQNKQLYVAGKGAKKKAIASSGVQNEVVSPDGGHDLDLRNDDAVPNLQAADPIAPQAAVNQAKQDADVPAAADSPPPSSVVEASQCPSTATPAPSDASIKTGISDATSAPHTISAPVVDEAAQAKLLELSKRSIQNFEEAHALAVEFITNPPAHHSTSQYHQARSLCTSVEGDCLRILRRCGLRVETDSSTDCSTTDTSTTGTSVLSEEESAEPEMRRNLDGVPCETSAAAVVLGARAMALHVALIVHHEPPQKTPNVNANGFDGAEEFPTIREIRDILRDMLLLPVPVLRKFAIPTSSTIRETLTNDYSSRYVNLILVTGALAQQHVNPESTFTPRCLSGALRVLHLTLKELGENFRDDRKVAAVLSSLRRQIRGIHAELGVSKDTSVEVTASASARAAVAPGVTDLVRAFVANPTLGPLQV